MSLNQTECYIYFPSNLNSPISSCQWSKVSGFWLKIFQSENEFPSVSINLGFAKFYPPRSEPFKPNSLVVETFDFYGPFKATLFTLDHSDIVKFAKALIEGQKLWEKFCKKTISNYHCYAFDKTSRMFEKDISFDASPQEISIHYLDNDLPDVIIPLSSIKYIRPLLYDSEGRELEINYIKNENKSQMSILFPTYESLINCASTIHLFLIQQK